MCYAGTIEDHVKQSNGGDHNLLNHYVTSYNSAHGQSLEWFTPQKFSLHGSGYVSNNRPVVQYSSKLDEIDNPQIGAQLKSNYLSTTHKDFVAHSKYDNRNQSPSLSTFCVPANYAVSSDKLKNNIFVSDRLENCTVSVLPNRNPLLLSKKKKSPVDSENFGYGPFRDQTTYQSDFSKRLLTNTNNATLDYEVKQETGCTRNHPALDTLTGHPVSTHMQKSCRWQTDRPIGTTHYQDNYKPYSHKNGQEPVPRLIGPPASLKKNSYVEQNKFLPDFVPPNPTNVYNVASDLPEDKLESMRKSDPTEYQNVIHAFKEPSVYKGMFNKGDFDRPSKAALLGRKTYGPIEASGFTKNEVGHVEMDDTPTDRLVTHNMTRFYPPPPGCDITDRQGHMQFNTHAPVMTVQTKAPRLSEFEPQIAATEKLESFPSYQARSIVVRDRIGVTGAKC